MKKIISFAVLLAVLVGLCTKSAVPTIYAASNSDLQAKANWDKYIAENKAEWDARDSFMLRSGVKVPRPRDLWAIKGYPFITEGTDNYTMQGVKIKSNWDIYLDGIGSNKYKLSVKNNKLTMTGENNTSGISIKSKIQLIKPTQGINCYVGDDGLAYVDTYGYNRVKFASNTAVSSSNTVLITTDEGKRTTKELSYTLDLSELSNGVYCIKESVWDTNIHKDSLYWHNIVVVIYDGNASLQATDILSSHPILPKATDGRVSYGHFWGNADSCSEGYVICTHFN